MHYKIEATPEQSQNLAAHIFDDYPYEITDKGLDVLTANDCTFTFFSMVRDFLDSPILVDYMASDVIRFVVLRKQCAKHI